MVNITIDADIKLPDVKEIKAVARKIVFESALKMTELATLKAPVDTGALKASIQMSPMTPLATEWVVSAGVNYAAYVEYGTKKQRAQPYFRPALHEVKHEHVKRIANRELNKLK